MRPGDPASHNGRVGKVLAVVARTVHMEWADGSTGYVRIDALAPVVPPAVCTLEQALDFVARAERDATEKGGALIITPLRVLLALRALARAGTEADGVRRAG